MKDLLNPSTDVGKKFFQLTIGHVLTNNRHLVTFYSTIKAFSAFGNLIVVTFTTARGKSISFLFAPLLQQFSRCSILMFSAIEIVSRSHFLSGG